MGTASGKMRNRRSDLDRVPLFYIPRHTFSAPPADNRDMSPPPSADGHPATADAEQHDAPHDCNAAADAGWRALRDDPHNTAVLNLLALAEHRRGNHGAAVVLLERAVKGRPDHHALWNDLGNMYCAQRAEGSDAAAEAAYNTALRCNPHCAEACNNLGVLASRRGDPGTARTWLDRALAITPDYPDALYNLGNALAALGRFQKALIRYEQAAELRPEHAGTHFNLAITRLLLGDMAGGWPEWEWRWRSTLAPFERRFDQPVWTGDALAGRRILLYAEQGIGDTLQFLRYVPLVLQRGGTIILEVQQPLVPLLKDHPGIQLLVPRPIAVPADITLAGPPPVALSPAGQLPASPQRACPVSGFDTHCSLMSLAMIFRTTVSTIPPPDPFLYRPASRRPRANIIRAGLVWAGNPTHERDRDRSIRLATLTPLLNVPGVAWVSLQKGAAAGELSTVPAFKSVPDLGTGFANFADTAAAIRMLDLVVTVDTSVAHLAGSMGKPVWILLPARPDWRWLLKRRDSPWYPTARLFRQTSGSEWYSVVHTLVAALVAFLAEAGS